MRHKRVRREEVIYTHEIRFQKVDGTEGSETFHSAYENCDEAVAEFLNTRLVVSAWIVAKKYFVQTLNKIAPFFEEEQFETLEDALSFADKQNAYYSVEGGGDGTFYCEVVVRIDPTPSHAQI